MGSIRTYKCNFEPLEGLTKAEFRSLRDHFLQNHHRIKVGAKSGRIKVELDGNPIWVVVNFNKCTCPSPTSYYHITFELPRNRQGNTIRTRYARRIQHIPRAEF